jgi:hypothetical protein
MSQVALALKDVQRSPGPPRSLRAALIVIAFAQLMVVLDTTIVNVALPSIQRAQRFAPTDLEWVVNAYALAFGGLLLLGGRAGDLFGRRRVFVAGVLLFAAHPRLQSPGGRIRVPAARHSRAPADAGSRGAPTGRVDEVGGPRRWGWHELLAEAIGVRPNDVNVSWGGRPR